MAPPTARQHCGFLIEVHDVDLTEMATDATDRVSAGHVPQENCPVSSRRREFGIVMRTAGRRRVHVCQSSLYVGRPYSKDLHCNRQHLVAMARVGLYLFSDARVPKPDDSILPAGQEVLCRPLCIRGNIHGAFVGFQGLM